MKRLIIGGLASALLFWGAAVHANTVISATGNQGNYVTSLENKVDVSTDANQPLADGSGVAITDSSYFSALTPITFTLSDDTGTTTNVRILAPGLDTTKFQMWAYSPADSKWYDVNAIGFGDPSGIPLDQALLVSPVVDLYVLGTEAGTTTANFVLQDMDNNVPLAQTSVDISIPDTIPPVIGVQSDITAEATSATGAVVSFTVNSTDNLDGTQPASCSPASGSTFALGTTTVTCDKTDLAGNVATSTTFDVIVQDTTAPSITLNGASTLSVSYGSVFSDPGATASDLVDGSVQVNTVSNVDTNVIGSYQVTYDAMDSHGNAAVQASRTVNVVKADTNTTVTCPASVTYNGAAQTPCSASVTGPGLNQSLTVAYSNNTNAGNASAEATFAGDSNYNSSVDAAAFTIERLALTVTADNQIKEFGDPDPVLTYSPSTLLGSDLFLGSLTRASGETVGNYAITQGTLDAGSNYNLTVVPGQLSIGDSGAPVITLNGDQNMDVSYASKFSDPGATATDNVDGTVALTVGGDSVETYTTGTYHITYDAVDSNGNHAAQVVRTVNVGRAPTPGQSRSSGAGVSTATVSAGEVLGAFTGPAEPADPAAVSALKAQIATLIQKLIGLLQAQLAAAITARQ